MSNAKQPSTTHYAYRQLVCGDGQPLYVIPLDDPMRYEHPFDHLFDTPEEAKEHLGMCKEEEIYGDDLDDLDLILVKIIISPVES